MAKEIGWALMKPELLNFGIQCRACGKQWNAKLHISGNSIEAFAAVCECGSLLVGNYYLQIHESLEYSKILTPVQKKKVFLSNGHFDVLSLFEGDLVSLEELDLE